MTAGITLDLPLPPSVNTMVRKLGNRSPSVQKWIAKSDPYIRQICGTWPKPLPVIKGPYLLTIIWPETQFGKFDCDNRVKVLQDYLQRIMAIDNDLYCWKLIAQWGDVEKDWCRVELQPRGEG